MYAPFALTFYKKKQRRKESKLFKEFNIKKNISIKMHSMAEDRSLPIKFSIWHTFKHHIPRFLLTILLDVLLPLVIYIKLQQVVRPVYALLAASSPPLCMILIKAIWFRTFDALGFLVFFSFIVTALIAVISRNPLIILLEKSLITGILSIMFGVTLIPIEICQKRFRWRPLAFYFYQDLVPTRRKDLGLSDEIQQVQVQFHYNQLKDELEVEQLRHKQEVSQVYEWLYTHCSSFRYSCYTITSIWSIGYFLEFLTRITLILAKYSINQIVIYGHIILSTITVIMICFTVLCITIERRYTLKFIERCRGLTQMTLPSENI